MLERLNNIIGVLSYCMTALALVVALTVFIKRRHLPPFVYWIGALYFLSFAANLVNNFFLFSG
ncbi:MAG: hypothetical protein ACOYXA_00420 [Bacteroidota bacterium]